MKCLSPIGEAKWFALIMTMTLGAHSHAASALDPDMWPHHYKLGKSEVVIYMPQVEEWKEFRHVTAHAAIAVKLDATSETTYGTTTLDADTITDFTERTVHISTRKFSDFRFPELKAKDASRAEAIVRAVIQPETPVDIPLDVMTTAVERGGALTEDAAVSYEPPPIFYSESPAILVNFIGTPKLEPVNGNDPSLMFAVNTNWDVLFDGKAYYLLAGDQWLTAPDLMSGPWTAAGTLPDSFRNLPDDGNWSEVKSRLYVLQDAPAPPKVWVSDRPSELLLLRSKPQLAPISGTSLLYVVNTDSDVFCDSAGKSYYYLTAGRWFSAPRLEGPWAAAGDSLPDDFAEIPANHPKSSVLVSVRGTPEADQAVILASIPQTATVTRATAKIVVVYEGDPVFKAIPGSDGVQYAINTPQDVFLVSGKYYCCYQGVWFQATAANGVWIVCDKVPAAIYTIPPQSPKYNVTYVHVYHSTPETVQVGVTSGYSGAYVARGLVVFGLGMWLGHELAEDDHWHHHCPSPYWYGYGCGAVYHPGTGFCRRGGYYYGPYGGAGYGAAYNPHTGTYVRSAYAYGPYGAVRSRAAYNPWTDSGYRHTEGVNAFGSWGSTVLVRDDEWVRTGHHSNRYRTISGIETSNGAGAVHVERRHGADITVGKNADGDIYVGRDGNIYKKDEDGWHKRGEGGWQDAPEIPNVEPYSRRKPDATTSLRNQDDAGKAPVTTDRAAKGTSRKEPAPVPAKPVTPSKEPSGNRPSYTNRQTAPSQLNRDAYSRRRADEEDRSTDRPSRGGRRGRD